MARKSSALRLAPPTSAPSTSGWDMSSAALSGFTEPPYWMRIDVGHRPAQLAEDGADGGVDLLRLRGGGGLAGADGPDRLVGQGDRGQRLGAAARPARRAPAGRPPRGSGRPRARPASRRRRRWGAGRPPAPRPTFLRTVSSVSPKNWRRSLWPTMTCCTPTSASMRRRDLAGEGALRLPVDVLGGELDGRAGQRLRRPPAAR